jgi:hypothetical protein
MPGINGMDQLSDEYTGDSDGDRNKRLSGVLKSLKLPKENFVEKYSVDTHSFTWNRFKYGNEDLEIEEKDSGYLVGLIANTKPRKIKVVYGNLENLGYVEPEKESSELKKQIKFAIEFSKYLDKQNIKYLEEPSKKKLLKKLSQKRENLSGLVNLFEQ